MSNIMKKSAHRIDLIPASDILANSRKLFLTDGVDHETTSKLLIDLMALNDMDPDSGITLFINSLGGEVYSGMAVYDYIRVMPAKLTTVCIGTAASMGALLFLAGDERLMLPHSQVMIHDPSLGAGSMAGLKPHELQKRVDDLVKVRDETANVIATRTKKSVDEILEITKEDTYYTAEEAIEFGLATGYFS